MHDPLGHGAALTGRAGFRHHFYTGHPRTVTVVMPSVVNPKGRARRLDSIQETWGTSARAVFVVHNISEYPIASHAVISEDRNPEDPYSYPQLLLVPESIGSDDGVPRLIHTITSVFEKINPDFAFFVNDHTYVIPEHLCNYLKDKNPSEDMYHGHAMKNSDTAFNSGAAGYVLSRETMGKLVNKWNHGECTGETASKYLQGNPGLLTTECLKKELGVVPVDTRQIGKYHRFHAFPLNRVVTGNVDQWYLNKHQVSSWILVMSPKCLERFLALLIAYTLVRTWINCPDSRHHITNYYQVQIAVRKILLVSIMSNSLNQERSLQLEKHYSKIRT